MSNNTFKRLVLTLQTSIRKAFTPQVRFFVIAENQYKGRKYQIMVRHNAFSLWHVYAKRWYKKPNQLKEYLHRSLPDHVLYISPAQREAIRKSLAQRDHGKE